MRFAIVGVGGAGGYFGARLAEAGHDVAFVARGAHLAAIRAHGLRVDSIAGDVVIAAHATDDPSTIGAVDYVLLGVKTWQVAEAAASARPLVGAATTVVPLQNGVEATDAIAEVLGRPPVVGGIARILSFIAAPGHIRHTGVSAQLELGELDGTTSPRVAALRDAFAVARGVTVTVSTDIVAALWAKFLFISSWGGVGAAARAPVGVVRAMPETRALIERSMHEIAAVARASSVALPDDAIARALTAIDNLPAAGTTSMQRDLEDGKPSELEHLVGAVVRLGERVRVATPTMTVLYHTLLPRERLARGAVAF